MTLDVLRVAANERIDLTDFRRVAEDSAAQAAHPVASVLTNPTLSQHSYILDGFDITNPTGSQIRVTKGRAILSRREQGELLHGMVATEGDTSRTIDIGAFAPGTYGVYIRFEFIDGENGARIFWNPTDDGFEYAQTMATLRKANWSMRIEASSPGDEWLRIATVDQATRAITKRRWFYYEGREDASTAYASNWGSSDDRNADRATYGVKDAQTFAEAMRQCLEDVKGRGIRKWYSKNIGGQNIGFDTDPTEYALYIRDVNTGLDVSTANTPMLKFGNGSTGNTRITHTVSADTLSFQVNNVVRATLTGEAGVTRFQVRANTFALEIDHSANRPMLLFDAVGSSRKGIRFNRSTERFEVCTTSGLEGTSQAKFIVDGFGAIAAIYKIGEQSDGYAIARVSDAVNGNPEFRFDSNDRMIYEKSSDRWVWQINNIERARISAAFNGVSAPVFTVNNDTSFQLRFITAGSEPGVVWDANDYLSYDRTNNILYAVIGGSVRMSLSSATLSTPANMSVGGSITASGNITGGTITGSTLSSTNHVFVSGRVWCQQGVIRTAGLSGGALRQVASLQGRKDSSRSMSNHSNFRASFQTTPSSVTFTALETTGLAGTVPTVFYVTLEGVIYGGGTSEGVGAGYWWWFGFVDTY